MGDVIDLNWYRINKVLNWLREIVNAPLIVDNDNHSLLLKTKEGFFKEIKYFGTYINKKYYIPIAHRGNTYSFNYRSNELPADPIIHTMEFELKYYDKSRKVAYYEEM